MIAARQLVALGLSREAIRKRVAAGRLTPQHRGVYRYGPHTPPLGPEAAALLACPGAVLSHLSAGALWQITGRPDAVHLTAPTNKRRRRGIVPHRGALARDEVRRREGLPLTSPLRTLHDVRPMLTAQAFRKAVWEASYLRLVTDAEARALLGRSPPMARHEGERVLLDLLARAGLPAPLTNQRLHGWEVDLWWPDRRVVVELDGFGGHGHGLGRQRDTRKDLALRQAGIDVVRVSGDQLSDEPYVVIATIAVALAPAA